MRVVNYHDYKNYSNEEMYSEFGDSFMYVGRANKTHNLPASPLANPFVDSPNKRGQVVDDPIAAYRGWLWKKIVGRDGPVMGELARMTQGTALACWCAPNECHADVIMKAWQYLACGQFAEPIQLPTKALSIQQPWAWLITRPDIVDPVARGRVYLGGDLKDIENRGWGTTYRGHFFIHAGRTVDKLGYNYVRDYWPHIPLPDIKEFETGGIVGTARLVDVVEHSGSRWKVDGQKGFVLMEQRPLPFFECPGQLKFFEVQYQ